MAKSSDKLQDNPGTDQILPIISECLGEAFKDGQRFLSLFERDFEVPEGASESEYKLLVKILGQLQGNDLLYKNAMTRHENDA